MANTRFLVSRTVLLLLLCAIFGVKSALSQRAFRAVLDGTQETPPVTVTTAAGTGTVELNVAETSITVTMTFSGLSSNQTAAHIHGNAPRGTAAGVLFNVGSSGTTSGTFSFNQAVTPTDVANLRAGLWYFNVHSNSFPGGEIRGQIEPDCERNTTGIVSWYYGQNNGFDSIRGNNLTLQNGTTFTNGKVGRSFNFDGLDDYAQSAAPTALPVGSSARTIELWFKTSSDPSVSPDSALIQYGTASNGNMFGLITSSNAVGKLYFFGYNADLAGTTTILPNQWYHAAVTYDGSTVRLYLNGQLESAMALALNTILDGNGLSISRRFDFPMRWTGQIDEPAIFDRALSAGEITAIYNAGAAGKCPACVATPVGMTEWWTGDGELFGTRNRNNGTLQGNATFIEGRNGHAFKFGGGGSSFDVPHSSTLNFSNSFTMDAWINPAILHSGISQGAVISKVGGIPGNNGYQFGLTANNSQIFCQFNGIGEPWPTNQLLANVPAGGLPLNSWSHIACSYNNSDLKVYLDGVEIGSLNVGPKTLTNSISDLRISGDGNGNVFFTGLVDEPHLFNRALSASEIASIVNSGRSCFCKPGATTAPSGLVGWWAGDGNTNDISGNSNNGTANNGAGFQVSKVGQGFYFNGASQFINVNDSAVLNPTFQISMDAWIYPTSDTNGQVMEIIANKEGGGGPTVQYEIARRMASVACPNGTGIPTGNFAFYIGGVAGLPNDCGGWVDAQAFLPLNAWSHVAVTYDGQGARTFVNGTLTRTIPIGGSISVTNGPFRIGGRSAGIPEYFIGSIDEVSLYNRGLTQNEVISIYNAGLAGKLKQVSTVFNPFTENRSAKERNLGSSGPVIFVGDATIFFQGTSGIPGFTQWMPIQQSKLPPLPTQWQGLTYDISTTWQYTSISSVCFNIPSFTPAQFTSLRLYHLESDNWVNRTNPSSTYPNLCTNPLTSLSPFAIGNLIPNAASVSVGGRVTTASGYGLRGAVVTMTDLDGVTRRAITSTFGYYRFDDVMAGNTYVVSVGSKRFTFAEPTRVVVVSDDLADIDFVSLE